MKTLVTGGAGFIGSHLVKLLKNEGHQVIVLDSLVTGKKGNLPKDVPFIAADVREPTIEQYFKDIDWVFHLAALTDMVSSIDDPQTYYQVNVTGTLHVLEACRKHNVKRFIYAASASCYGLPQTFPTLETAPISPEFPYALTKRLGEELTLHFEKVYKLPSLSLRLFNVYGPKISLSGAYGSVFSSFLKERKKGSPLPIFGSGNQTRDFIYVEDVANAFYLSAQSSFSGDIFNVGSGEEHTINTIAKFFSDKMIFLPKRDGETLRSLADISKIRKALSWEPKVKFKDGIKNLISWAEIEQNSSTCSE